MKESKRVLEPIDRVSEVLFGLIMVLTFTGSLSVATAGHTEVREMLIGALGCNLAWGIIDALFYVMGNLADRGRGLAALHAVRGAATPAQAHQLIAGELPPLVASLMDPPQLEALRERLVRLPEPERAPRLQGADLWAGLAVCLLVFVSTLPVVIPFLFVRPALHALRVSNGVAVAMLFVCGFVFGRWTRFHPWWTGLGMVLVGSLLASMTMMLGG